MFRRLTLTMIATAMLAFMAVPASAAAGWVVQTTWSPGSGSLDQLIAVSCASTSSCVAVGDEFSSAGVGTALAEGWNGGSVWTLQDPVNPPGDTVVNLRAVSCPSATYCVAVGSNSSGKNATAVAESWNGSTWSLQAPVSSPGAVLAGVSCTAASSCEAVGWVGRNALAEHWNGSAWTTQTLPAGVSALSSVSCVSASDCEAIGSGAVFWNGSTWAAQTLASPFVPHAVSCTSASSCVAVGGAGSDAEVERWNGSTWTIQAEFALPSNLFGVSCASASSCVAAGQYETASAEPAPFAEYWNGTSWTQQSAPEPSGAGAALFQGISCPATTDCTAVGDWYVTSPSLAQTLAEQWTG